MRSLFIRFLRVGLQTAHPCQTLFILLGLCFPALASAVTPNTSPTFVIPGDGVAYGTALQAGSSISVQADGKILVAGVSQYEGQYGGLFAFALVRYNSDASLDTSFGQAGMVTTAFGATVDWSHSVTLQTDGKILVAGSTQSNAGTDFAVARYNTNGSLDTSFGAGGLVTTDFGSGDIGYSITVQNDGKILVAGTSGINFALVRYNTNGSLDTSFGTGGKVTTSIGSFSTNGYSVTVQTDGKILVAGTTISNGAFGDHSDFALARYNTDGSLDSSFGNGGTVTTDIDPTNDFNTVVGTDYGQSVTLQTDGKILVAGSSGNVNTGYDYALVRYDTNGSLDTSFGNGGKVTTDFGSDDFGQSVTIQPDGKILMLGYSTNSASCTFAFARYSTNGSLDTSFGTGGKVTTDFGSCLSGQIAAVQPDGKILVAVPSYSYFALARYNTDGSLDTSFDQYTTLNNTHPELHRGRGDRYSG